MQTPTNPFKNALAQRQPQIGLWLGLANAYCAEICAGARDTMTAVLANDQDADGDVLTVTSVQQTVNAAVSLAPGGTGILYDPVDAFVGTDVLQYTVIDGFGGTASGQVTVRVPDTMAPVFSVCAPAQAVDANAGGTGVIPALTGLATATDNVGVTSLTQLDEDLDAWGTTLSPELLKAIDAIRWELRDPAL